MQYMMWHYVFTGAGGRRDKDGYLYHKVFTANLYAMQRNKLVSVKRKETTTTKHTHRPFYNTYDGRILAPHLFCHSNLA